MFIVCVLSRMVMDASATNRLQNPSISPTNPTETTTPSSGTESSKSSRIRSVSKALTQVMGRSKSVGAADKPANTVGTRGRSQSAGAVLENTKSPEKQESVSFHKRVRSASQAGNISKGIREFRKSRSESSSAQNKASEHADSSKAVHDEQKLKRETKMESVLKKVDEYYDKFYGDINNKDYITERKHLKEELGEMNFRQIAEKDNLEGFRTFAQRIAVNQPQYQEVREETEKSYVEPPGLFSKDKKKQLLGDKVFADYEDKLTENKNKIISTVSDSMLAGYPNSNPEKFNRMKENIKKELSSYTFSKLNEMKPGNPEFEKVLSKAKVQTDREELTKILIDKYKEGDEHKKSIDRNDRNELAQLMFDSYKNTKEELESNKDKMESKWSKFFSNEEMEKEELESKKALIKTNVDNMSPEDLKKNLNLFRGERAAPPNQQLKAKEKEIQEKVNELNPEELEKRLNLFS